MNLRARCTQIAAALCRCRGTGVFHVPGEPIARSQLSAQEQAELMVNGGVAYQRVQRTCPKHAAG